MPKLSHEALVQLVRNAPTMIPALLWPDDHDHASAIQVDAAEFVERRRVLECGDEEVLDGWMARVLDARALADVFAG